MNTKIVPVRMETDMLLNKENSLAALERLHKDPAPVQIKMTKFELWTLLATVQLACRHPQFQGPSRVIAEGVARQLGESLTRTDLHLRALFEAGWDWDHDEVTMRE